MPITKSAWTFTQRSIKGTSRQSPRPSFRRAASKIVRTPARSGNETISGRTAKRSCMTRTAAKPSRAPPASPSEARRSRSRSQTADVKPIAAARESSTGPPAAWRR
jgi:hypothetical protein